MKLIKNTGNDRVIDELRQALAPQAALALASPAFSLFAFAELREVLEKLDACRMVLPAVNGTDLGLTGTENDRAFRNRLQVRWLARECAAWIRKKVELRSAPALLPQSVLIVAKADPDIQCVITGNCAFTTEGLGLTPGNKSSHIQRFGRIDRIGSSNERIQLINFWPNIELEEYINLEQRVSGRMVLLDISATGEENIIEHQSGNQMNDLEYRRKQLLKLQDAVIDLEDLSSGVSIADLTLNDFRIDLSGFLKEHPGQLEKFPPGTFAVTTTQGGDETAIPPGVIFCLRAAGEGAVKAIEPGYPLAPHYVVHVGDDGTVLLPFSQAKQALDRLKRLTIGRDMPDAGACNRFDKATKEGRDMRAAQDLLAKAVSSILGKNEERAIASLFTPGGTHAMKGEFQGINDFEVVAFLVVLPEANGVAGP